MTYFICGTCGTQYDEREVPPVECAVCADDRQFVDPAGQRWTTQAELGAGHRVRMELDGDLLGLGITPTFAIPQRALVVATSAGNLLWDCIPLVTDEAVAALAAIGGIDAIAISHPHFYSAMVDWSDALGGVPILLHEADRAWVRRPSSAIEWWSGDTAPLSDEVTLIHLPGHFPGSAALHWTGAPHGRTALLAGDSVHVTADRRHVTVMHSVPNYIPAHPEVVRDIRRRLEGWRFDDVYGFTWGLNVIGDARAQVDASFERYLRAVGQAA